MSACDVGSLLTVVVIGSGRSKLEEGHRNFIVVEDDPQICVVLSMESSMIHSFVSIRLRSKATARIFSS